jgi:hypothetical protein
MFDKQILLEVGGYSTELVEYGWFGFEDYDLWLKLAQNGYSCKLVPAELSSYRVHSASMINTTNQFRVNMARYFNYKFPDLAKINTTSDKLFGSWRNLVTGSDRQNLTFKSSRDPASSIEVDRELSTDLDPTISRSQELSQCYETIKSMQSSKFWKIRTSWLKFKEMLGFTVEF